MGKHLSIGFLTACVFVILSIFLFPSLVGNLYLSACILAALLFGMMACCTSIILEKLDTILELTAAQSAKLSSTNPKENSTGRVNP